jgi:molecular chaperone IbpA
MTVDAFGVYSLLTRLTKETHMTLTSLFPSRSVYEPFTVGFDKLFDQLQDTANNIAKNAPNWPPYNIKKVKDNKYVIEMAVAGFAKSDIEVTVEGNKLVIKGDSNDNEAEDYIFKGIANRAFQRTFTIADKVEIKDAEMVNGMLRVWLENLYHAQESVKKIAIKDTDSK